MANPSRSHWKTGPTHVLLAALGLAALLWLYAPVLASLAEQWLDDANYRHGLLVPVISAILIYRRWPELRACRWGGGTVVGALIVLVAAGLLIAGTAAGELMTTRASLPMMIIGLTFFLLGREFAHRAAFPLLLLFMMVPLPYIIYYKIAFPLQLLGAKISAASLSFIGVSVIRYGNVLHLPNYSLEVVAACSGLRSLMTMITLALIMGAFSELTNMRRVVLVLLAVPAALVANVVRLVMTGLGAYLVSPSFADGFLHTASGFVVFITGLAVLLIFYLALKRF